jgi:uncharacterized protein YukJ
MPIQNYSVLKGKPTTGKVVQGNSPHYQITVEAPGGPFTVAVNIESTDGSEVLYTVDQSFTPPDPAGLAALAAGFTKLPSQPGGLALDFVRETIDGQPMVTHASLTLLPISGSAADVEVESPGQHGRSPRGQRHSAAKALSDAIITLIQQAIAAGDATLYAFGSAYADSGKTDGIHDIHMNQGNPTPGGFAKDNGVWQDGALFVEMPGSAASTYAAVFVAFQTESWNTDSSGNPV